MAGSPDGSHWRPAHRFVTVAIVVLSAVACSGTNTNPQAGSPSAEPIQSPAVLTTTQESDVTTIRITVDDRLINAQLADNPTAQDLAGQLPMTLSFRDFNRVEKVAELPRPLTTEGVPEGDDPDIADIGYYAPSNNLVLYYGDVGYWAGIVRIGQFNSDSLDFIKGQPDGFQVTIEQD
jgi:hypothetical protein